MEEKKNKKCLYCGNFETYYTKGMRRFERTRYGICMQHNKIVFNDGYCDLWKTSHRRLCFRKRAASRALYEILMDILAIRQIMQENQEEEKNCNEKDNKQ